MFGGGAKRLFGFRGLLGVPVDIDAALVQLVLLIVLIVGLMRGDMTYALIIVGCIIVSIYLHEVGHAAAAKLQGVQVHRIVLHGFGGYCIHANAPPRHSLIIVLGGPAVNLALWLLSQPLAEQFLEYEASGRGVVLFQIEMSRLIGLFGQINILLCIFNLLPVLPLDGGRVLFLSAWFFASREMAMRITGFVGLIISVLWIPAAIVLFISAGVILLFFPSIRENWRRFRGMQAN